MYSFLDSERIYNRMDELRKEKNMSIYELAKRANVSCAAIYKWRDRKSTPSMYLLECICYALNVSYDVLLGKAEAKIASPPPSIGQNAELLGLFNSLRSDQKDRKSVV